MNQMHNKPNQSKHWLNEVLQIILSRIDDPSLTISKLAREVYMSERQFYRKIKETTGKTPNRFLQSIRMKKAQEILENKQPNSIKEVALSVGYTRTDYFSRLYESIHGKRPEYYFT